LRYSFSQAETAARATETRRLLAVEAVLTQEQAALQAEALAREEARKVVVADANRVFFCETCDKQYTKVRFELVCSYGCDRALFAGWLVWTPAAIVK
jgi:hypothetical protein